MGKHDTLLYNMIVFLYLCSEQTNGLCWMNDWMNMMLNWGIPVGNHCRLHDCIQADCEIEKIVSSTY